MGVVCCREEPLDFNEEVELSHFTLLRSVGKGAFGKVRVVQHKGTKQLYALKYINKVKCIQMRAVENIISERQLLERIECNLIVNMRYAFQDDENMFMILDLMLGGDLRFHFDRHGPLPEEQVRFYAAEVAVSLHYLHSMNIVHRDLKPDNILLDEKGHAHLTDFNIAAVINERKPLTSIAGSFAYIAPEVLLKKGYLATVDWWSLGIVCYELLYGKRPFRGKTNDVLQQAILHDPVLFPENAKISANAVDFVRCLLTRDSSQRIGAGEQGFQRLMAHPWFSGIPWDKLESKEVDPPFVPDSKRANFDPTHELEEILLEDNPLKVKKRSAKRSQASNVTSLKSQTSNPVSTPEQDPERVLMEEKFITFDYTKPDQNQHRMKMIEQKHWAQKMTKATGEKGPLNTPNANKKQTSTYGQSVVDILNNKPATPLTAGDILKLEELARTARAGGGKGSDWRPPSGLMGNSSPPDGSPLDAVQARDNYILQNGGVPPPFRPPPFTSSSYDPHSPSFRYNNPEDNLTYQGRRSSDDSYRMASSPDNCEYPLMASSTTLNTTTYNHNLPVPPPARNYTPSATSTTSSRTLNDPLRTSSRMHTPPRLLPTTIPPPSGLPPPIPTELPSRPKSTQFSQCV